MKLHGGDQAKMPPGMLSPEDYAKQFKALSERMNDGARMAFEEDRAVLEDVHAGMKDPATPFIDLGLDAGAKLFRLMLSRKIDDEQKTETAA